MDQETRNLFSQQLAHWARQEIAEGRSPFRRVDLAPLLLTPSGERRPPLVFWINRESFMAGGVVLLPDQDSPEVAEMGRHCAEALGLRHFVTWGAREIRFWEVRGEAILTHKSILLDSADSGGFQKALRLLLEELKLLSVLGALPPTQLSPYYLANLLRSSLAATSQQLTEEYRAARAQQFPEQEEPQTLAYHKGAMTLLRLLTLTYLDQLPTSVQPENLEVAMFFALDALDVPLQKPLLQGDWELPLPASTAVRFHHLFRRLAQLDIANNRQRLAQSLEIFIDGEAQPLGASRAATTTLQPQQATLFLHPARPATSDPGVCLMEVGSPPLLALLALLRAAQDLPPAKHQANDVFALTPSEPPALIQGSLAEGPAPTKTQRQAFSVYLRNSWPSRRFLLDPKTPRWSWELLHLLGLAAHQARIQLETPVDWLTARHAEPLIGLLQEEFTLCRIALLGKDRLSLKLVKDRCPEQTTLLESPFGCRQIGWQELCESHRSLLPLALKLDEPTYALLEAGSLVLPSVGNWPEGQEREIFLFSRSSVGRLLWELISGGQPLPPIKNSEETFRRQGLPLPGRVVLDHLAHLGWSEDKPLPSTSVLDEIIACWLGQDLSAHETVSKKRSHSSPPAAAPAAELIEQISAEVFTDGIPRFPEQYLYQHYRPQLTDYRFAPPLTIEIEFFGLFTLQDAQGQQFQVEGEETAQALLLCASAGASEVSLPSDRQLMLTILEAYRHDLRRLRQALVRQTHMRVANAGAAAHMTEKIWNRQSLPAWDLINGTGS